jgi:hypothetical protein
MDLPVMNPVLGAAAIKDLSRIRKDLNGFRRDSPHASGAIAFVK